MFVAYKFPVATLFLVAALAFRPATASAADQSFDSGGVRINYSERGAGEPVVLIHGWLSSGWINWDLPGITDFLAKNHRVVWLDMPGHGKSDKTTDERAYGMGLVKHVERLLDHLQIRRAHLIGYSMGGIVAARFTVEHPDRVLSTTLGGMGWLREGSLEQKVFAAGGKDGKPVGLCFKSLATLALTEQQVRSIRTPVQILFGANDGLRHAYVPPLTRVRPDWKVIEIPDGNHLTCLIRPPFKQELRKWLDANGKRNGSSRRNVPLPALVVTDAGGSLIR